LQLIKNRIDIAVANEYLARVVLQKMEKQGEVPAKAINFVGCYPGSIPRFSYMAFSSKNPQAKKLAQLFDEGITRLRDSGELQEILDVYGMNLDSSVEIRAIIPTL